MFDKLKQLSKDTAVYGISTMVGRFLSFLLVPFYTNIFLPDQYGIITNIYAFIGLFNIIYLYGMDTAFLRYAGLKDESNFKDVFSTPYLSVLVTSLLFSLIIILLQVPLFKMLAVPDEYNYLIYFIALIMSADAVSAIPFVSLRLQRKAKRFALFKIINILTNVSLNLYLILKLKWGIEAVFVSNLAASLVSLLLLLPDILKNFYIKFEKNLYKKLLKFGLPYLPAGLASQVIQVIDRPILEHLTDLTTLGIYQANYKLGIFMMLFVNMFQFAWQPFFLQEAKEKNAKEIFAKVLTYFTIIGSFILIILTLFIDNLVKIEIFGRTLIGSSYWGGLDIVPVILLGYLLNGMYVIFTAGIFIKEKTEYVPMITGLGALVNIITNFLLIPVMGIMGAAVATFASYLVMALGLYIITQKVYKIDYENIKIIKIFLSVFLSGAAYYYLLYSDKLLLLYKFLILLFFLSFIVFFVIDKKEIEFLKRRFGKN